MEIILVSGPPCSGKTTYTQKYNNFDIISSDEEINLLRKSNLKLTQIELNKLGLENVYKKIKLNIKNKQNTVYDGTNLTKDRRKHVLELCKSEDIKVKGVNIITDFNSLYNNWINRGKDIKIESMFFLYSIYQKINRNEGFSEIINIKTVKENKIDNLKLFLEEGIFNKEKIIEENKDLFFLDYFWNKAGKNFFEEYNYKLSFLDDLSIEDKLALLYSEIKYFYNDFISRVDLAYKIKYNIFIDSFYKNIILNKVISMGLNKEKTYNSFKKIINIF